MVGRRAVAALLLALVSAVAEDAAEDAAARLYLVEGVAPAAGRLEAAAVERAVEALSLIVVSSAAAARRPRTPGKAVSRSDARSVRL